ncbi:MAG: hypothetical protein AB7G20_10385 [Sulfurimonas sp.]|uniref:hypothetical protein n=1 Tax=Sulfurimonas sp. TaxID=2022749 RepID=UPI003D109BAB
MKTYNYCTLFDSFYLTRGLAMYESLIKQSDSFNLYIFAFDDKSYNYLSSLKLANITVISLTEFEDNELLSIKDSRTKGEYCWTCTPSIIKYSIENFKLDHCTYLDADLYFFSNPSVLVDEMNQQAILLTEHRYTPIYDKSASSGIYCVQFMTFKNTHDALTALEWWRQSCNAWCYARHEDGKFGDQMYLDDWATRFNGVYVLTHLGGGVAPWNIQQYKFLVHNELIIGKEKNSNKEFNLIFYHFHALRFLENNKIDLSVYSLKNSDIEVIYKPYIKHIHTINQQVGKEFIFTQSPVSLEGYGFKYILSRIKQDWLIPLKYVYRKFFSRSNIKSIEQLI